MPGMKREVIPVARYEEMVPVARYEERSGPCCQVRREKWSLLSGMKREVVSVARYEERSGPCCQV